jgi:spore coat protein CotF
MADFTEQELLDDLLTCEKNLLNLYNTAVIESSTTELRDLFKHNMAQCMDDQFSVWKQMHSLGYYPTKPADQAELNTARQKFSNIQSNMQM